MIKSYFKIAWRNLQKNKLFSFVNILGLTVGIVSCLLIGVYIKHELSYDNFHANADKLVRITMEYNLGGESQKMAVTGTKVGPQFKNEFPEIVDYVRLDKLPGIVKYNTRIFKESRFMYADPSFFSLFSFPLVKGDKANALSSIDKIVVTESTAKKYFGDDEPIGKTLVVGNKSYIVSAVAKDAPSNSQIKFDFLVSFNNLSASKNLQYFSANYITYFLLKDKSQMLPLQAKIQHYMIDVDKTEMKMGGSQFLTYYLMPLTKVHLNSNLPGDLEPAG